MNFSVHMDEDTVRVLAEIARETGKTRNAIIRQAVQEWVARHRPKAWPPLVTEHLRAEKPLDLPPFESMRSELVDPEAVTL